MMGFDEMGGGAAREVKIPNSIMGISPEIESAAASYLTYTSGGSLPSLGHMAWQGNISKSEILAGITGAVTALNRQRDERDLKKLKEQALGLLKSIKPKPIKHVKTIISGISTLASVGEGVGLITKVTTLGKVLGAAYILYSFGKNIVKATSWVASLFSEEKTKAEPKKEDMGMAEVSKKKKKVMGSAESKTFTFEDGAEGLFPGDDYNTRSMSAIIDTRFRWVTMRDDRVRPTHAALEGKIFLYSDGANGLFPGQEYNCRCKAVRVD